MMQPDKVVTLRILNTNFKTRGSGVTIIGELELENRTALHRCRRRYEKRCRPGIRNLHISEIWQFCCIGKSVVEVS